MVDTRLVAEMIQLAAVDAYDVAVLLSGDRDLAPATANADGYARQASDFLRRSQADGLPTKIDADGVIRVFDPKSNTFGAFNPDGSTRTFFKPSSPTYWKQGSAPWKPK